MKTSDGLITSGGQLIVVIHQILKELLSPKIHLLSHLLKALHLQTNSIVIDGAVPKAPLTTWTDYFWENEFVDGIISAHGKYDVNGNERFNRRLDIGAEEVVIFESQKK